jgi:histidinol dehydrogenase
MSVRWFSGTDRDFSADFAAFLDRRRAGASDEIMLAATQIVRRVRREGGSALVELTEQFDGLTLDPSTLTSETVDVSGAADLCPEPVRRALEFAASRIEAYHRQQLPASHAFTDQTGAELGWRWSAIDAVGLYVPGGRASYPSSLLMNAIPARTAGVSRLALVSPAPGGRMNPAVAYAAKIAGVNEYYPIGGAQAVAALAYGAGPIRPVDKIVGPGNAWVAAAKRVVFGDVGIDTVAGPSEITVVADEANPPEWIAADLLSQCEHDPLAQAILITDSAEFAERVLRAADEMLASLSDAARTSWNDYGAVVIVPLSQAADIVNRIAPEHVEIAVEAPDLIGDEIRHAGALFLGRFAPEALGDYVTGSNHVLPTSGAARFASGLSVLDFMKRTSVQRISERAFRALGPAAETLAGCEGLPAHARSVSVRSAST